MPMCADDRQREVLRRLRETGYVGSAEAARDLHVSEMTVRRDMTALEQAGLGRRVPGGLGLATPPSWLGFDDRTPQSVTEKQALCRHVAGLIEGAAYVGIDAGTTVLPLVSLLLPGTTVVTASVPVVEACLRRDDLVLVGLGGEYQPATRSFGGPATLAALRDLSLDVAVLSAAAITTRGCFSEHADDAATKRGLLAAAASTFVIADASKLTRRSPVRFCTFDEAQAVLAGSSMPSWVAQTSATLLTDDGVAG